MKRNELTLFSMLKPGDRFYKAQDKKKVVFEITDPPYNRLVGQWAVEAKWIDGAFMQNEAARKLIDSRKFCFPEATPVIFLRSRAHEVR